MAEEAGHGGGTRLVGPFPSGADPVSYDRLRRRVLWSMPSGLYVLGSRAGGRRNLMTLNWATQVAVDPKLIGVSVEAGAVTNGLVRDGRSFALSLVRREDRAVIRKFVKPLDDTGDPSSLGGVAVTAHATGAPVLAQAAAWLDCEVLHEMPLGSHTLFVGEVVDCGGDDLDGQELLRMEDTRMSYGG